MVITYNHILNDALQGEVGFAIDTTFKSETSRLFIVYSFVSLVLLSGHYLSWR